MLLENLKTTDLDPSKKYVFVLPFGATEQHGPFAPLGTDSFIQREIIARVEPKFPEIVFLPTFSITSSQEHEGFPGTVWLRKETFDALLKDVCHSLLPYARAIVFSSWHGGNLKSIDDFITIYGNQVTNVQLVHAKFDEEEATKKMEELLNGPVDEHAGNTEISMLLATHKDLVVVPPPDYPKKHIENAWASDKLKDVSEDGIVDNNPQWIVNESLGEACINLSCTELETVLRGL